MIEEVGTVFLREICVGITSHSWFDMKNIVRIIFLSVRHYKFINLSVRHHTVSTGQFFLSFFLPTGHCGVSQTNSQIYIVSHG
jgi:hypothetical protein